VTDTLFSTRDGEVSPPTDDRERRAGLDEALLLEHVSGVVWRVCDSRHPAGSDGRFLGFVEERDGLFEVMQIAETFIWTSFESMRAALDHVVATNEEVAGRRKLADPRSIGRTPQTDRVSSSLDMPRPADFASPPDV
jgi:hypothetical protein